MRSIGVDLQRFEVKACRTQLTKDIARTLSAFSNGSGGLVICGLSERDGFTAVAGFVISIVACKAACCAAVFGNCGIRYILTTNLAVIRKSIVACIAACTACTLCCTIIWCRTCATSCICAITMVCIIIYTRTTDIAEIGIAAISTRTIRTRWCRIIF